MPVEPPLIECSFLVPIRRDKALSDARLHSTTAWEWLTDELWERFGGATRAPGFWEGFYADPSTGQRVADKSRQYIVAVPDQQLGSLRDLLSQACGMFHQKCIYLSVAGAVEFIYPTDT